MGDQIYVVRILVLSRNWDENAPKNARWVALKGLNTGTGRYASTRSVKKAAVFADARDAHRVVMQLVSTGGRALRVEPVDPMKLLK